MRIVFVGCVEIGLKCLRQILRDGYEVSAVFTLAKKYARRTSGFIDFGPLAKQHGSRLHRIKDINAPVNVRRMHRHAPDLIVICGWQRLVSAEILGIPPMGTVGFHSSLLPKYRGRAPVNWALINGEKRTGVTMFFCDAKADTGDIIAQRAFPITPSDTCATVYEKSARAACRLLHEYLPLLAVGKAPRRRNPSAAHRFWPKRRPEDGLIDWNRSPRQVHDWIRAQTHPYPGAFTFFGGRKYHVWISHPNRCVAGVCAPPGTILRLTRDGSQFVVAVRGGILSVSLVMDEDGRPLRGDLVGHRFHSDGVA